MSEEDVEVISGVISQEDVEWMISGGDLGG
jgi:hypothetical protein